MRESNDEFCLYMFCYLFQSGRGGYELQAVARSYSIPVLSLNILIAALHHATDRGVMIRTKMAAVQAAFRVMEGGFGWGEWVAL